MMKPLNGWYRLFIVYALLSALWCFYEGAEAHRRERIDIESVFEPLARTVGGGVLPEPLKRQFEDLETRRQQNLSVQAQRYGAQWLGLLLLGAVAIGLVRFVVIGFRRTPTP